MILRFTSSSPSSPGQNAERENKDLRSTLFAGTTTLIVDRVRGISSLHISYAIGYTPSLGYGKPYRLSLFYASSERHLWSRYNKIDTLQLYS